MRLLATIIPITLLLGSDMRCTRSRPAQPPPPPVGLAAISIEANGPVCCNNCPLVDKGHIWKIRNLRTDVAAFVTYHVYWNSSPTSIPNWQLHEVRSVMLPAGHNDIVMGNYCRKRLQGETSYTTGDYKVQKYSACTMDQANCKEILADTVQLKNACIESFPYALFTPDEKAAAAELYRVLTKPNPKPYKFKRSIADFFGACPRETITNTNDLLELSGTVCTTDILLPYNVDVTLSTGPDYFNSIYITSTDYMAGTIKRAGATGLLTLSTTAGLPYTFSVYLEVSKTYKTDILRTVEAKGNTLVFKGDFVCFEITGIPEKDIKATEPKGPKGK